VGPRAVLDAVKRKISSPRRESNPRTPIIQPAAQRYTVGLSIINNVRPTLAQSWAVRVNTGNTHDREALLTNE
jgi:hypothetical protein